MCQEEMYLRRSGAKNNSFSPACSRVKNENGFQILLTFRPGRAKFENAFQITALREHRPPPGRAAKDPLQL